MIGVAPHGISIGTAVSVGREAKVTSVRVEADHGLGLS